jgi:hypothetical protein
LSCDIKPFLYCLSWIYYFGERILSKKANCSSGAVPKHCYERASQRALVARLVANSLDFLARLRAR